MDNIMVNTAEQFGWDILTNQQLLTLITGSDETASVLNEYLTECTPSVDGIVKLGIGIGEKTAIKIKALHTLFTRKKPKEEFPMIRSSVDLFRAIQPNFNNVTGEVVWLMLINAAGRVCKKIMLSKGSFDCALLDVRMVVKYALEYNCPAVALAHNHPAESLTPSMFDKTATKEIQRGCKLMRIRFVDHIIVSGDEYYSFSDDSELE